MTSKVEKPECYLLVIIGPLGFDFSAEVRWFSKPPDNLYQYTRGEGQALLFKLGNYDASSEFAAALVSGEVPTAFSKEAFRLVATQRRQPKASVPEVIAKLQNLSSIDVPNKNGHMKQWVRRDEVIQLLTAQEKS